MFSVMREALSSSPATLVVRLHFRLHILASRVQATGGVRLKLERRIDTPGLVGSNPGRPRDVRLPSLRMIGEYHSS